MEKNEHYVYMVIDKETFDVKYIGKGKGKRCYNILSGVSNNCAANQAYHTGLANNCDTYKIYEGISNSLAVTIEKSLIYAIQPKWNSDHKKVQPSIPENYMKVGRRIQTLISIFKNGLWKLEHDRVEVFLCLIKLMWVDRAEDVDLYLKENFSDAPKELLSFWMKLRVICDVCADNPDLIDT